MGGPWCCVIPLKKLRRRFTGFRRSGKWLVTSSERGNERRTENGGDFWLGQQAQHRVGHRAEAARGGLAAGHHVHERTTRARGKRPDRGTVRRNGLYVRPDQR